MPPLGEIAASLYGAFRLALFDKSGFDYFNKSRDGFWGSFFAAAIAFPVFILFAFYRFDDLSNQPGLTISSLRFILVETVFFAISWLAYPVLMLTVSGLLGRTNRYFDYMVPYNWAIGVQSLLYVPLGLLIFSGGISVGAGAFLTLVFWSYLFAYTAFVAHHGLKIPWLNVAGVVALDFILTVILETVSAQSILN